MGIDLTKPEICGNLTYDQFCYLLRGDDGTELLLMNERYQCLLESSRVLCEKFGGIIRLCRNDFSDSQQNNHFFHLGTFVNCIRESGQSAQKLLDIVVSNFSHFRDEAKYEDIDGKDNE